MRPTLAVILLLATAPLLAGCTAVTGGDDGPALATAQQAQPAADRAAKAWAEDAQLYGASAIELDREARREAADDLADSREEIDEARADGDLEDEEVEQIERMLDVYERIVRADGDLPGDGRAAVWFFVYAAPSMPDPFMVAVHRGHSILQGSEEFMLDEADADDLGEPLGEWKVDSDDATDAARLGSPDFQTLCGSANVVAFTNLGQGADGPVWYIGAESDNDELELDEVFLAVDAINGSMVLDEVDTPLDDVETLYREAGFELGSFAMAAPRTDSYKFEVRQDGHARIAYAVSVSGLPVDPVTFTITDPNGNQSLITVSMQEDEATLLVEGAPAGSYDLEVTATLAPYADWDFGFCTDGVDDLDDMPFIEDACDLIDDSYDAAAGGEATAARPAPALGKGLPWGETLSPLGLSFAPWPH